MSKRPPLAIVAGIRTPFCKIYGPLKSHQAVDLGVTATTALLKKSDISPSLIHESIWGNVSGQPDAANLARVISLKSGIPREALGHTVNRNCASGIEAVITSWQVLMDRDSKMILAGGTESMSNVPLMFNQQAANWFIELQGKKTFTSRMSHFLSWRPSMLNPVPGLKLGLTDPVCKLNMGETAENLVDDFHITREEQDQFALQSHQRAIAAQERGFYKSEITPVEIKGKIIAEDVGPRKGQTIEALTKLKPVFKSPRGTVTAGNSSQITDGAVALVVCLADEAKKRGLNVLGYLRDYSIAGLDPSRMGLGPVFAIHKLLAQNQKTLQDFQYFEINEAFASQVLACQKALASPEFNQQHLARSTPIGAIDPTRLNVNGGAIALGHPVGATGARLILTLLRQLRETNQTDGIASLCVGGGQGVALWVSTKDSD